MTFSDLFRDGNGMGEVWIIFIIEWPIFMALAWYLEQVISSGTGVRRHWLFPFKRTPRCVHPPRPHASAACLEEALTGGGVAAGARARARRVRRAPR